MSALPDRAQDHSVEALVCASQLQPEMERGQKCCPATLSSGHSNSHPSQDQKTEEGVVSETGQYLPEAAAIELWGTGHPLLVAIVALFGPPSPSGPSLAEPSEKRPRVVVLILPPAAGVGEVEESREG